MNIQNIPREDLTVKRAFVPKLDLLMSNDYPNIEAKLLAYYLEKLNHPSMADFFRNDKDGDLHIRTAQGMFGKEDITKEERSKAKTLNFSIIYGGGIPTLLRQGVAKDAKEALSLLRAFHDAWPGIGWESRQKEAAPGTLVWHIKKQVEKRTTPDEPGYIETLWGRQLHPRSLHSALNALLQGCAADLIKWACIEVHKYLMDAQMESHITNVIHDDILMDVVEDELPILAREVPTLMTYLPVQELVPIRPEPEVSYTNWAEKEAYDLQRVA